MDPILKELELTATALDGADPLAAFRSRFHLPKHRDGTDLLYFCGHSLGLQPKTAAGAIEADLRNWAERAVRGHFKGTSPWLHRARRLAERVAGLVGARGDEIAVMNTLTVNLHLLMVSFYRPRGRRRKILIEAQAFPSDRYAVESQLRFHGLDPADCLLELAPRNPGAPLDESELEDFLQRHGDEIALVLWPGVQYATGQLFDLARIAAAARGEGARCGFDLAHAVGNVPLQLHDSGADFAAWCHYKYLNAGPGAIAGAFVHQRHHGDEGTALPRFHGWWGNHAANRFEMRHDFTPGEGIEAWEISTPPLLSMTPLETSLDLFDEAGMDRLREKSQRLWAYLAGAIRNVLHNELEIITPESPERHGCQLSLRVRQGRAAGRELFEFLEEHGALADWREPDVIRVAPAPLYNRFADCYGLLVLMLEWSATGSSGAPSA